MLTHGKVNVVHRDLSYRDLTHLKRLLHGKREHVKLISHLTHSNIYLASGDSKGYAISEHP